MAERDASSNETTKPRDNDEDIVGQPMNQKDDEFEDDDDADVVEDVNAEEGE